jgi:CBS domain-containing protein
LLSNDIESLNIALNTKLNEASIGKNQQLTILRSTDSLKKLLKLLVVNQHVLVSIHGKFSLISQMDLIKFFQHNNHHLGSSILDITVPFIPKQQVLIPVSYKSTAAQAFLALAEHSEQNALPVVDANDEFIGEVNAQVLNDLDESMWPTLMSPVMMFLKTQPPPFTCGNHFTLSQVMTAFVLRKAHRLWWIDVNGELKGVISLSDILSLILSQL